MQDLHFPEDDRASNELWGVEQLENHARLLARPGPATTAPYVDLVDKLKYNRANLEDAYKAIAEALRMGRAITPAAEWFIDNYHIVTEQISDLALQLPTVLWRSLPDGGHGTGASDPRDASPRIFNLMREYLAHTDCDFDADSLVRFLAAYQQVAPLRMRELWLLSPMLRLALLDRLRFLAIRMEVSLAARGAADKFADTVLGHAPAAGQVATALEQALKETLRFQPFIVQLVHRLQSMGDERQVPLDFIATQLAARGQDMDEVIQKEHARRSARNLTVRNIITSLRAISSLDWRSMFERTSLVEHQLGEEASYLRCDRRTRDRYRSCIEELARNIGAEESAVVDLVRHHQADDIGELLIGARRRELEQVLGYRPAPRQRLMRTVVAHASRFYIGAIIATTVAAAMLALHLGAPGTPSMPAWWILAALALLPASELATGAVNWMFVRVFPPRSLPRLHLLQGLNEGTRTLVVMPVMLAKPGDADACARLLEVHALANVDPFARFALLTDWTDSSVPRSEADTRTLEEAERAIAALNERDPQPPVAESRFYLFHRERQWNKHEGCFMGWERKRGKLAEMNRLLLGCGPGSFITSSGAAPAVPAGIRYVLTLDADTRLPMGSVRELVGIAAHPLNHPVIDAVTQRVVRGYALLQPRITPLLPTQDERSLYRAITTSGSGLDPYAAAISDLYQDVFAEGLFTGKGLYDLQAFETVMRDRVPQNTLLSHDLFEGLFLRCGLVTDIELYEDFPSHSEVAAARSHRWIRGDWQLLPWILGLRGKLPPMGRWKMLDNLRRSLIAPVAVLLMVAAWSIEGARPVVWMTLIVLPWLWPGLIRFFDLGRLFKAPSRRGHLRHLFLDLGDDAARAAVWVALTAQNAWLSVDAIGRALTRMLITRRRRLEWTTAAQSKAQGRNTLASFEWPLKSACIVVLSATACILWFNPSGIAAAAPLLALWWLSPLLAHALSRPMNRDSHIAIPSPDSARELTVIARSTWSFFERFVTARENDLPPDNFQLDPLPIVAHRTSPTNIGLYLLSTVAARDFGWLGAGALCARLLATLQSLQQMERFNGHFLNWYDTRSLAALLPRYVSTVDSGNLVGHLIAVRQAMLQQLEAPALTPRALRGPVSAISLFTAALSKLPKTSLKEEIELAEMLTHVEQLQELFRDRPATLLLAAGRMRDARVLSTRLEDLSQTLAATNGSAYALVHEAARLVHNDITSHAQDMDRLLPELAEGAGVAALPIGARLQDILECHQTAWNQAMQLHDVVAPRTAGLRALEAAIGNTRQMVEDLRSIAAQCHALVAETQFGFLFDSRRGLFSIGYRVAEAQLDDSYYDLLASEARLASLVAIAKTDVPRSHWFRLGRRLTGGSHRPLLASWSGSMFEYLMPSLVMHEPRNSLLGQSVRRAVRQQINYGAAHGIPWGVSESAYNVRDHEMTYQYSAFGLPSLGLKRGLGSDLVIAPYATALAAMIAPDEAAENFRALTTRGARGSLGFHEAIDFTQQRLPQATAEVVIHAYMAHHQGMALVALANTLHGRSMQDRFHADPMIQAAELLLQERAIRFADVPPMIESHLPATGPPAQQPVPERHLIGVSASTPVIHLLSNRRYSVMVTDSGAGYSHCAARAVTRWRADSTQDCWGSFIYLRDTTSGRFWSAGFQPTAAEPDDYEVQFSEEQATFRRRDGAISTTLEVIVSAQDDAELRRVTIRNQGGRTRMIEVTSYAELVMAPHAADVAHPAFSNLSVQTEYAHDLHTLLATRRPRSSAEPPVWAAHLLTTSQEGSCIVEYDTDRMRFIGRGRSARSPLVIAEGRPLANTVGNVLDPIFSLRTCLTIEPGTSASVTFVTLLAESRAQAVALATRYRHPATFEHGVGFAWTMARAELHHLQSDLYESRLFQSLAGHLLYPTPRLRAGGDVIAANTLDITRLWRFSISGDRPILLIRCHSLEEIRFVRQCLRAQEYLRSKRFYIDIVILNELEHSYFHELQDQIERAVRTYAAPSHSGTETRGTVHALQTGQLSRDELTLLQTVARVILRPAQGSLAEHLQRTAGTRLYPARPLREADPEPGKLVIPADAAPDRGAAQEFRNGLGGFDDDGREYVITLGPGKTTPAPWCNVLANEEFGSLVSESGSMCSWWLNGRENQLTPWSNDAVSDPSGEAFYIHDSESDQLWSPTAQPVRLPTATYETRHGQGYSHFLLQHDDIASELMVFVAHDAPARVAQLRITNHSGRTRRLSVVAYVEWTLGPGRSADVSHVVTQIEGTTGAMLARNSLSTDFGTRVSFCDLGGRQQYWTGSRSEFLGRNGARDAPAGIARLRAWSGHTGGGVDPCCAFAVTLTLAPGATEEVVSVLGQAENADAAAALIRKFRAQSPEQLLLPVRQQWDRLLGSVQIQTPDRALDLMFNRWLLYQTITCRMWGRAGFYQAGGAFGFRDQLQDAMALSASSPGLARQQLLRAAARQFPEGDVQHWWHPPSGRGVRTHCSDDRIWLPYVAAQYIEVTEDDSVLDEFLPFIEGPTLPPDHEDSYFTPTVSPMTASFYEHCARALDVSLKVGVHGLPLIGSGDWNDGMNRVGREGRGESVWLAWFLIDALHRFSPIAQRRGETDRVRRWAAHARALAEACETHAWDGAWYRRAFYDDGTPLGSAANNECRIDSLAQTWAVLSGAADKHRAEQAMVAVDDHLVRPGDGLVLLFTPPFDTDPRDPGYIKGYLPGLRENGGQYTHAAIWVLMAAAALRDQAQVGQLLDMLNPVRRTESRSGTQAYRVEPYVIAADIYATPPHARRGGWTWYTGAAGWLYRAVQESVLGIRFQGQTLTVKPCMPAHWTHFDAALTRGGIDYALHVQRADGQAATGTYLDNVLCADGVVPLVKDGKPHQVRVVVA